MNKVQITMTKPSEIHLSLSFLPYDDNMIYNVTREINVELKAHISDVLWTDYVNKNTDRSSNNA